VPIVAILSAGLLLLSGQEEPKKKPSGPPLERLCGALPAKTVKWKTRYGPLRMSGSVVIGPGRRLELEPGTVVVVDTGDLCPDSGRADEEGPTLSVEGGTFLARGLPGRPVVFQPAQEGASLAWGGIRIRGAKQEDSIQIHWTEIRRARVGVGFEGGAGLLRHGAVTGCGIGISILDGATPRIEHSVVDRSVAADIVSSRSAPSIQSCLFLNGGGDAVRFDGIGLARVENSCFWGHRGQSVVRGPDGVGGWKRDSVPDRFGNWRRNPILRNSPEADALKQRYLQSLSSKPWWLRQLPRDPPGSGPWSLSPFSPLLGKGDRRYGVASDIGLWGGR
jgi:hypothetical protein